MARAIIWELIKIGARVALSHVSWAFAALGAFLTLAFSLGFAFALFALGTLVAACMASYGLGEPDAGICAMAIGR